MKTTDTSGNHRSQRGDRREDRFEREEKLGRAAETLPAKTLADREINAGHAHLTRVTPRSKRHLFASSAETSPVPTPTEGNDTRRICFRLSRPEAGEVCVAGSFNDWSATNTPLARDGAGDWRLELKVAPGLHEYRFVVDGQWQDDPDASLKVPNPYGTLNAVAIVT